MRVDTRSLFLKFAFAFKANLTLWFIGFTLAGTKIMAVSSRFLLRLPIWGEQSDIFFLGRAAGEQASEESVWGVEGLANNYGQPCMGVKIINIFLIVVAEFGRLWGIAKNAFNSFV